MVGILFAFISLGQAAFKHYLSADQGISIGSGGFAP